MKYALLAYGQASSETRPIDDAIAEVLATPEVTGWARLSPADSATTLHTDDAKTLLTDGPFIDSKEYLIGLFIVEADDLDGAIAIAQRLQDGRENGGAMEVRPIVEGVFHGT